MRAVTERGFLEIAVDSPLHPYLDESGYLERIETQRTRFEQVGEPSASPHGGGGAPSRYHDVSGQAAPSPSGAFSGRYGRDLFTEVAHYAEAAVLIAAENDFDLIHAHDW